MLHWLAASRAEHIPPAPRPTARAGRPRLRRRPHGPARRPPGLPARRRRPRTCPGCGLAARPRRARRCGLGPGRCRWPTAAPTSWWPARSSSTSRTTSASWPSAPGCCSPGGTLVIDAIAATRLARLIAVGICSSGSPADRRPGIHDPALFVDREAAAGRRRPAGSGPPAGRVCGRRCGTSSPGGSAAGRRPDEAAADDRGPLRRVRAQTMRRRPGIGDVPSGHDAEPARPGALR